MKDEIPLSGFSNCYRRYLYRFDLSRFRDLAVLNETPVILNHNNFITSCQSFGMNATLARFSTNEDLDRCYILKRSAKIKTSSLPSLLVLPTGHYIKCLRLKITSYFLPSRLVPHAKPNRDHLYYHRYLQS